MINVSCGHTDCKYSHSQEHEVDYFIYLKKNELTNFNSGNDVDIRTTTRSRLDSYALEYKRLNVEPDETSILYLNNNDFNELTDNQKNEYIKTNFCQFHAPMESSWAHDYRKTKRDVFESILSQEKWNRYIYRDIAILDDL